MVYVWPLFYVFLSILWTYSQTDKSPFPMDILLDVVHITMGSPISLLWDTSVTCVSLFFAAAYNVVMYIIIDLY